jgi:Na+-transporting methylmalonyl-CoA/oxaloacetate decarboxylase gamma subunit
VIVIGISTLGIVLLVLLVLVLVLAGGGYIAMTRRTRARDAALQRELAQAEDALAQAHALDKGWDRARLEAAARVAAAERFGDAVVGTPQLVQVIDRPGVDADQAVFRVESPDGREHRITLGRAGGEWGPA